MQQVYGSQCLGRTAVFEWHKRFLEVRETLEDDKKSGRPILVRTPEMIKKIRDFVANDRNASLKMMEEALNISRETIRTILHEDWGKTKVCAKFVPHVLRSDRKSARINYSRDIVAAAENNPNFLKSIITGDEAWCFQYDPETKRQSAEWKDLDIMKCDINRFDTSDYAIDNAYDIPLVNKKVLGLMKDKNNGAIMTEFGLIAKMYALRVYGKKDTKKASNVTLARSITVVYTVSETKIALTPYDDKQYIVYTQILPIRCHGNIIKYNIILL
ncbi:SETMR methyltransferase, partial [Pseudoatta argentina]